MSIDITRRQLSRGAGGIAMAGLVAPLLTTRNALAAKPGFTAVEWGGTSIKAAKAVAKKWGRADIRWVLYANGAASVLPKISAQWPDVQYDLVANWDPVFDVMIREGWLETITSDEIPNLKHVPEDLIIKDKAGNFKTVPRSITGACFGYRKDTCPIEMKSIGDLLNPKLRGQICWPDPIENDNLQMVALALYGGGDEHNMEPAWAFMKKLAKTGNISLIANGGQMFVNAMTTGQTSIGFFDAGSWTNVARHFPCELLSKVPDQPGLKFYIWTEGWCVMKGTKHKKLVLDYINFALSRSMNQQWNYTVGDAPANQEAKASPDVKYMEFSESDLKQYAYRPDFLYISKQLSSWSRRFEVEIIPLLG